MFDGAAPTAASAAPLQTPLLVADISRAGLLPEVEGVFTGQGVLLP